MTPLKNIKQDLWLLPPAEIMPQDDLCAMWDAWQAAYEADLGEAPFEMRREMGV